MLTSESNSLLKNLWTELASRYSDDQDLIRACWEEIDNKYSGNDRHYHNLDHIRYMLNLLEHFDGPLHDRDLVKFSIFYHDIIYDPMGTDNEEKSAELAADRLATLGLPDDKVRVCSQQILATRNHHHTSDYDTNVLLDLDLAVLGEQPEIYYTNSRNIRKEYELFPEELYTLNKNRLLQDFYDMDPIYNTREFRERFENQARTNLKKDLEN